jgi:hypothetical protein
MSKRHGLSLVCQSCNLLIVPKSRLAFFLRYFELTLFVLPDATDTDLGTEGSEDAVLGFVDDRLEC